MIPENDTSRFPASTVDVPAPVSEESLVHDARAGLTPAQMVEQKLVSLLQSAQLPLSRMEGSGPRRPFA